MSPQAWMILLVLLLVFGVSLASMIVFKQWSIMGIAGLVGFTFVIILMTYDTECLVRGQCHGWSWIRTIVYSIMPVALVVMLVISMAKKKKNNVVEEEAAVVVA